MPILYLCLFDLELGSERTNLWSISPRRMPLWYRTEIMIGSLCFCQRKPNQIIDPWIVVRIFLRVHKWTIVLWGLIHTRTNRFEAHSFWESYWNDSLIDINHCRRGTIKRRWKVQNWLTKRIRRLIRIPNSKRFSASGSLVINPDLILGLNPLWMLTWIRYTRRTFPRDPPLFALSHLDLVGTIWGITKILRTRMTFEPWSKSRNPRSRTLGLSYRSKIGRYNTSRNVSSCHK